MRLSPHTAQALLSPVIQSQPLNVPIQNSYLHRGSSSNGLDDDS
ncbi:MAG: hypothetical protein Q9M50_14910 [Methylococcales bacterium]|nr:hypothetical protein [Methylococcales bacterium]MDQ7091899.1 hypothetical protein [Methylococcales bacterium]